LTIKKSRLRWFGSVEYEDDTDWVRCCMTLEIKGIRQRGRPKNWWDCVKAEVKVQSCSKWRHSLGINGEEEARWQLANPASPGKVAIKTVCVFVCSSNKPFTYLR